jgi:3-hydroxyisobutyryl-CoA hydrolase
VNKKAYDEYILYYKIAKMIPNSIFFYDGIVMGCGVGISVNGRFRIATENAIFAMPGLVYFWKQILYFFYFI